MKARVLDVGKNHMTPIPPGITRENIRFRESKVRPTSFESLYNVTDDDRILAIFSETSRDFNEKYLAANPGRLNIPRMDYIWSHRTDYIRQIDMQASLVSPIVHKPNVAFEITRTNSPPESLPDVETLLTKVINQNAEVISYLRDSLKVQQDMLDLFRSMKKPQG